MYDYYDYGYDYSADYGMDMFEELFEEMEIFGAAGMVIFALYMAILLGSLAFSLLSYILQSVAYHSIAKRRGIRNGWLAWIPVGNLWIIGSISDQYQYLVKGKIKNRRKLLIGLYVGILVLDLLFTIVMLLASVFAIETGDSGLIMLLSVFSALLVMAVAVAVSIIQYMCLYDLFRSCNPGTAVIFLLLTIFISFVGPFLIFASRKKDLGMPPKKQPAPRPVYTVPEVPVVEAPAANNGFAPPGDL